MPELPEVQTTVNGLKTKVLNRTFVDVWSDWKKLIKKPDNFQQFEKEIKNKQIIKIYRRAKNIIINLSDNYSLLIHQKMTGHLLVGNWQLEGNQPAQTEKWIPVDKKSALNDSYNKFLHVIFFLDDGQMLALSDVRKFAKIELWRTDELLNSKGFKNLGPEPLEKSFSFEKFKQALLWKNSPLPKLRRGAIKQILMIPEVIAGIGNIYASEALWHAKIHPAKNTQNLKNNELKALYKSIQKVLTLGIELGGDSFSDYRNINGEKGKFNNQRKVYKRENQICLRCKKETICRIVIATRGTFYCPSCQKL